MPLYEYRCESCDHQFEVIRKFSDAPLAVCPKCSAGPVVKLISSPAFQFKGSGWYITDYARKDQDKGKDKADTAKSDAGNAEAKTGSKESKESKDSKDSKPDTSSTSSTTTTTPAKSD